MIENGLHRFEANFEMTGYKKQPNIVLIILDTARAQSFSSYGYDRETTPNIDKIAQEGVSFENAISPSPWTLPAHASIFTGMYPSKHGAHEKHKYLDDRCLTLPEFLKSLGYSTIAISNNSWVSSTFGLDRGFDRFVKLWQLIQTDTDLANTSRKGIDKVKEALAKAVVNGNVPINVINGVYGRFFWRRYDYGARRINKVAKRLITRQLKESQPFFLFINYLEPHLEYRAPAPYYGMFLPDGVTRLHASSINQDAFAYIAGKVSMGRRDFEVLRALYDAEIAYLDFRIGELHNCLRENGLLENTLLIITSDHGENIGEHDLMDHQYCLYDTLLKVPLFIRYPKFFPVGENISGCASLVDIFPTIMDVLGVENSEIWRDLRGKSLLRDGTEEEGHRFTISEYIAPQPAIDIMIKRYPGSESILERYDRVLLAIRTKDWKLIEGSDARDELYNIKEDPGETQNMISIRSDVASKLREKLRNWRASNISEIISFQDQRDIDRKVKKRLEALGYLT